MRLLIGNDDGVFAQGIRALANGLAEANHEVYVVCPDRERSATGHGLTLHDPIRAETVEAIFHPEVRAWASSGTPSDCIKLALSALLPHQPDFVLAGINHGPNLGTDILYSGTVSAAMEGLMSNIPSIAFSLADFKAQNFDTAARFARSLLDRFSPEAVNAPFLLNVNIPPVSIEEVAGVCWARLGIRRYVDVFEQRTDPRGRHYYWLAGEVLEDIDPDEDGPLSALPTDVSAVRDRFVSLTPLHFNLTDCEGLAIYPKAFPELTHLFRD